jgi:hypothetical protein
MRHATDAHASRRKGEREVGRGPTGKSWLTQCERDSIASKHREDLMARLRSEDLGNSCSCGACANTALSRRTFLCTGTGMLAAGAAASVIGPAAAQQPPAAAAPGRALLIKNGHVLTLDRALGDFETAAS